MNKTQTLKTLGFFIIIFILILIVKNHIKDDQFESNDKKKTSSNITCSQINLKPIQPIIDISGRIQSANKINIISEVNGVSEIYNNKFEVGEKFQKGEILISIKDNDIELELKSIKSQFLALLVQVLPDIKMDFSQLGDKFEKYINNFSIESKLLDLPKPANSKERNFLSSRQVFANYYTIKALENKLDKFKIRAPFDGVVTKALIDIGSSIMIGQPIGEFINPYKYEIISSDDLNTSIEGSVTRIGSHINELTQSIDVFISINDTNIKDGMYATAQIICDSINDVFKIERKKILNNNTIYVVDSNHLKIKEVDIVAFQNDSVIIKGLDNNHCIVDQYRQYFYDGMSLK